MIKRFKLLTTVIAVCILSYSFINTAMAFNYQHIHDAYIGKWNGDILVYVNGISKKPDLKTCRGHVRMKITKYGIATFVFSKLKPVVRKGTKSSLTDKDCSDLVGNDLFNGRKFTNKVVEIGNPDEIPPSNYGCITTSTDGNGSANNLPAKLILCQAHELYYYAPNFLHGKNKINNLSTYISLNRQH